MTAPAQHTMTAVANIPVWTGNDSAIDWTTPMYAAISLRAADRVAAEALVAELPKYVRPKIVTYGGHPDAYQAMVCIRVDLLPTEARGSRNEAGLKRLAAARKALAKMGIELAWDRNGTRNAYPDAASFDAAIA